MITRPSRANSTLSVSSACVPTASAASPDAMRSSARAPVARAERAEHRFDRNAERQQQRRELLRVLRGEDFGRRHQRALHAAAGARATIAAAATSVLPLPTSPCKRRFIGAVRAMSRAMCSMTRVCAPVGANGSSRRTRVQAVGAVDQRGARRRLRAARA